MVARILSVGRDALPPQAVPSCLAGKDSPLFRYWSSRDAVWTPVQQVGRRMVPPFQDETYYRLGSLTPAHTLAFRWDLLPHRAVPYCSTRKDRQVVRDLLPRMAVPLFAQEDSGWMDKFPRMTLLSLVGRDLLPPMAVPLRWIKDQDRKDYQVVRDLLPHMAVPLCAQEDSDCADK